MKNRLIKEGRKWLTAMCILTMCGLTYSCSDDYDLPDKKPSWLGASIYDYLVDQKNYTNTVRLIQDLGYQEVLERTGSKTLFVADDDAFAKFYQNNSWGVHKYEDLTRSQKSLLLSSSMLDNAYLLEMMTNISSGSTIAKNQCLRQPTSASATDSIPFFAWDGNDIPQTFNEDEESPDIDYWKRFRTQDKGGIWLALDGSTPLMLHFLAGQMGENNITDEDFETLVGSKREPTDAHIYGSKVIEQDQTCLNGYVDKLDRVLLTPDNMAEMIRTNGKTNIFSHMLDRFSAPFYNASLTSSHLQLTGIRDSVFSKRYFSARSSSGRLDRDPYGNTFQYPLDYDPGWNEYYPEGQQLYTDMGAMFVPSDEVLEKYFLPGGAGEFLMEAYAKKENTAENLIYNIDQIPLRIICKFVQNLMKTSFINTVPSKYITIMNDAKDPMFGTVEGGVEGFRATIDTTLLANNGAVYIMNQVFAPAAYAAVSAPALVGKDMKIFNWAISADDSYITNPNSAPLNAFFSYYLLAMSSRFSFFIPTDDALGTYYDEVTAQKQQPRMLSFYYSTRRQDASAPVKARSYRWDPATNEIGSAIPGSVQASEINNRLKDLLDSHIIVHSDAEAKTGFGSLNQYYVTKGGSAVKISNQSDYSLSSDFDQTKTGFHVQGGFQIDNDTVCTVLRTYDRRQETTGYGNGMTYVIDKPIQTTMKSVYSVLQGEGETSPFYQFFNLCQVDANLLERAGVADSVKKVEDKDTEIQKYTIFTSSQNGLTDNVRFFNSFRYTVYVPTNEAVLDAIDHGLPTWEEISEVITNGENEVQAATDAGKSEEEILAITRAYKIKAQAMITCLVNFLKYHFQDNSIFADRNAIEPTKYETACINNATNRYRSVKVSSTGNGTLNVRSVYSTDAAGNDVEGPVRKVTDDATLKNIMTRDYTFNAQARNATTIETSSYAVVHQIDGVLNFKQLTNDRYDSDWATTGSARRFIAKYRIRK
jgi:uncharacterized surface protein with fasciclin (FAS1) repeats